MRRVFRRFNRRLLIVILVLDGLFAQLFVFGIHLGAKLFLLDFGRFGGLLLLELFLVYASLDVGAVDKNGGGVDHLVVDGLVENELENLGGKLGRKAFAEGVTHCCKSGDIVKHTVA